MSSDCNCKKGDQQMNEQDHVPNFAEEGFDAPEAEIESSIQDISSVR
jgi:hypothetical protein